METLTFAAATRSAALSPAARATRIAAVARTLGLQACLQDLVGGPGHPRGVSGGERRRISVGVELVTGARLIHTRSAGALLLSLS